MNNSEWNIETILGTDGSAGWGGDIDEFLNLQPPVHASAQLPSAQVVNSLPVQLPQNHVAQNYSVLLQRAQPSSGYASLRHIIDEDSFSTVPHHVQHQQGLQASVNPFDYHVGSQQQVPHPILDQENLNVQYLQRQAQSQQQQIPSASMTEQVLFNLISSAIQQQQPQQQQQQQQQVGNNGNNVALLNQILSQVKQIEELHNKKEQQEKEIRELQKQHEMLQRRFSQTQQAPVAAVQSPPRRYSMQSIDEQDDSEVDSYQEDDSSDEDYQEEDEEDGRRASFSSPNVGNSSRGSFQHSPANGSIMSPPRPRQQSISQQTSSQEPIVPKQSLAALRQNLSSEGPQPFIEIRGARKSIFERLDELETLNSLPYKYCLRLSLPYSAPVDKKKSRTSCPNYKLAHEDLHFELICLDPDNLEGEVTVPGGMNVEKHMKTNVYDNHKEIEFRVSLNAYSHGFNKKAFVIKITEIESKRVVMVTKPFMVFARRNRTKTPKTPKTPKSPTKRKASTAAANAPSGKRKKSAK